MFSNVSKLNRGLLLTLTESSETAEKYFQRLLRSVCEKYKNIFQTEEDWRKIFCEMAEKILR